MPFHPDPAKSSKGKPGLEFLSRTENVIPYRWGFGVNALDPTESDLDEPARFLSLLEQLGIRLVNITAGSPYYNPHIQRPALYPPSDGYLPPEDPLVSVARQMEATRRLKQQFPHLIFVGTGYSYLQDFLPHVAQAALREGWVDMVGLGRMVLTYPELLWDASEGRSIRAQANLQNLQRLHHRATQRLAFGVLSAGWFLQRFRTDDPTDHRQETLTQP